ncbi:hypothetical protein PAMA_014814 [Pampus argenteus]
MVAGMLMPLRDLRAIYEVLFRDGVMVAKKDKRPQMMHPEVQGVTNLQVIRAMGSLKSRGFVKETFAWRHFYWYLSNEGIVYLRDYLRLPPEIVPASLQRVRKPAATLAVAHRAARVQSVEGPTSYVPKPGHRGEAESQEALAERQSYRHRMMGSGEKESYSDKTPRFRGRPLAAEPVRPKASWEMEGQPMPLFRNGSSFRSEATMMEESKMKRVCRQPLDVSSERAVTASQERRVSEKAPSSVLVPKTASKQDVSHTMSVSSITAPPLTVAAVAVATDAATSEMPVESFIRKTNKEKLKIVDEEVSTKPVEMVTGKSLISMLPDTEVKEKVKKVIMDPVKSAEVKATAENLDNIVKPQPVITTAIPVITKPVNQDVKELKTKVDPVKPTEVKTTAETATNKVNPQAVITMTSTQETTKLHQTATATPVITKAVNKDVTDEKLNRAKVNGESIKPAQVKSLVESKIDHEKVKTTAKVTITQKTVKPQPDSTVSKPEVSTNAVKEMSEVKVTKKPIDAKVTSVNLSAKSKIEEVHQKTTMVTETSILEVKTTISTATLSTSTASSGDVKAAKGETIETEMITKQEKTDVKTTPHVKEDEQVAPEEVRILSVQVPTVVQKDASSVSKNATSTEVVIETKQVVEGSSKSKRKKKKSQNEKSKSTSSEGPPGTKVEEENISKDNTPEEVPQDALQPTPVINSELLTVSTSIKTEGPSSADKNKAEAKINIAREQIKDVPKQTETLLPLGQASTVPPVDLPDNAQIKTKVEESSVSKTTQGPCSKADLNEPVKSMEIAVTKVETVTVQKTTKVELIQESSKTEEKTSALLSQKHTDESKSLLSPGTAAEESLKTKKKRKGKKQAQAQAPASETVNVEAVCLPKAEASTDITSLPNATVKDTPVMASELEETNASPKMTLERMCSEETRQAAAVLSEASADKGEVEPASLFAEKIKQEVPKPKTSSTAREAPAAGEVASAAPAVTAESVVAQQASPLIEQEESHRVAQHSATQAAERSTEKRLSVSEALKQEEEKKSDLEEDTPSATATPAAAQPHLGDTCESESSEIDEATMKRKIVVVEEIVEVKQVLSPDATGEQSTPPPVQTEGEGEGEELDLDVLEAIAIERALLAGSVGARVQGASPESDWDHSLEDPEEKTWPNFIEDMDTAVPLCQMPTVFGAPLLTPAVH